MTAIASRRRRHTQLAAIVALVVLIGAGVLTFVGARTIANSKAGGAVVRDTRPVVFLPNTDNAALAAVDDEGRLTSLVVATLSPSGVGGSIVTVPINADASIGLGDLRRPLNLLIDPADPTGFFEEVEATLSISLSYGEIAGRERLAALIDPVTPVVVDLPTDVLDGDPDVVVGDAAAKTVVGRGEQELTRTEVIEVLIAFDRSGEIHDHHSIDGAIWAGLAANTPIEGASPAPTDSLGVPLPAASIDEVFRRLWSGEVQTRDLALQGEVPGSDVDHVVLDRRDVLLVFGQTSPARVSTPNSGLAFRIEVPFDDEQMAASGGEFDSRSELARVLIGELLFFQANVTSVATAPLPDGAPAATRIEVADDRFLEDMVEVAPLIVGDADVVRAGTLIDGVDVVIRLGTDFLVDRADRAANGDGDGGEDGGDDAGDNAADDFVDDTTGEGDTVGDDG